MDLDKLILDLEEIENVDVMKESVEAKLKASLSRYVDTLNGSCEQILQQDCLKVVKKILTTYNEREEEPC